MLRTERRELPVEHAVDPDAAERVKGDKQHATDHIKEPRAPEPSASACRKRSTEASIGRSKHGGVDDAEALDHHQPVFVIGERVRDLRGRVVLVDADSEL